LSLEHWPAFGRRVRRDSQARIEFGNEKEMFEELLGSVREAEQVIATYALSGDAGLVAGHTLRAG